ncbi:unnamed protein product, partial [Ixodes hexagonus]
FICLPKPVKFDACTSIRLLGPCQSDADCDTQVCCKDWCGNYCAFKQRAYAVDNRHRPAGDELPPIQPRRARPRDDSDKPNQADERSPEDGEDDGGPRRRRPGARGRYKR